MNIENTTIKYKTSISNPIKNFIHGITDNSLKYFIEGWSLWIWIQRYGLNFLQGSQKLKVVKWHSVCSIQYHRNMMHIRRIFKFIFILSMFSFNIWQIVWPSIEKYLQKAIVVEVSTRKSDSVQAPAATFCRYGPVDA